MIFTEFYDGQGLGNQLWVYASARSIAEELDVPFVLMGAERFKGKEFLDILPEVGISGADAFSARKIPDLKCYNEIRYYDPDIDYISSGFDPNVLALRGANKLEGLFQSEKYFFGNHAKIRSYVLLKDSWKNRNPFSDEVCVINLRGGEYKRHKNFILPKSYWMTAIGNMKRNENIKKFLVVTDDIPYARAMFPGLDVLEGGIGDCYSAIYNARYLILSNSTFPYFPIKTSAKPRVVIAPKYWARYSNPARRWASVANLYESWLWQDPSGRLSTYEECREECDSTERDYQAKFFIRTSQAAVSKPGMGNLIPVSLKMKIKKLLSIFLPRHFG